MVEAWDAEAAGVLRLPSGRLVRGRGLGQPRPRFYAGNAFAAALARATHERVEVACAGGHGRTGTALACIAILDGVPVEQAVGYVREHYRPHAVETAAQQRYVRGFGSLGTTQLSSAPTGPLAPSGSRRCRAAPGSG